ncbi:hypothetical protein PM082_023244 [Marasmius tenuissimus]|nr:hypothetical protein PM082_023244 [Marasmius tenuissimus]
MASTAVSKASEERDQIGADLRLKEAALGQLHAQQANLEAELDLHTKKSARFPVITGELLHLRGQIEEKESEVRNMRLEYRKRCADYSRARKNVGEPSNSRSPAIEEAFYGDLTDEEVLAKPVTTSKRRLGQSKRPSKKLRPLPIGDQKSKEKSSKSQPSTSKTVKTVVRRRTRASARAEESGQSDAAAPVVMPGTDEEQELTVLPKNVTLDEFLRSAASPQIGERVAGATRDAADTPPVGECEVMKDTQVPESHVHSAELLVPESILEPSAESTARASAPESPAPASIPHSPMPNSTPHSTMPESIPESPAQSSDARLLPQEIVDEEQLPEPSPKETPKPAVKTDPSAPGRSHWPSAPADKAPPLPAAAPKDRSNVEPARTISVKKKGRKGNTLPSGGQKLKDDAGSVIQPTTPEDDDQSDDEEDGGGEGGRKGRAGKPLKNGGDLRYFRNEEMENYALEAIERFVSNPISSNSIPGNLQGYIRDHASRCPQAGSTCREIAVQTLVSKQAYLKCNYHHHSGKHNNRYIHDNADPNAACPRLTGVPYPPSEPTRSEEAKPYRKEKDGNASLEKLQIPLKDGVEFCHCGCTVEDALWGFYLWKTGEIHEGDRWDNYRTDWLDPRQRKFHIERLKEHGVRLENLWEYRLNERAGFCRYVKVSRAKRLGAHMKVLQAMLEELESASEDEDEDEEDDEDEAQGAKSDSVQAPGRPEEPVV